MTEREERAKTKWATVGRPGYFGKRKDELFAKWDSEYGKGNWRIVHETSNSEILDYENIFWKVYVSGYVSHFLLNPKEADYLTNNFSYTYDKHLITCSEAFDPYTLHNKPGVPNQFHHTALNIALKWFLGKPFLGNTPIQVRQGKVDADRSSWPDGWRWSPGYIKCTRPDLIPLHDFSGWWESDESIEAFYQYTKVVQVKRQ